MMPAFQDLQLQSRFERDGFVGLRLLSREEAEEARRRVATIYDARNAAADAQSLEKSYHVSLLHPDRDYRLASHALVQETLAERVSALVGHYRLLVGSFVVKPPGAEALSVHRDWTMTADPRQTTLFCWCALEDVGEANGAMAFIPGSHTILTENVEGPAISSFFSRYRDRLRGAGRTLPLRAGEAVLFDNRILHWSTANAARETRFALSGAFIPEAAQPAIYVAREGDRGPLHRLETDAVPWADLVIDSLRGADVEGAVRVENRNESMGLRQLEQLLGVKSVAPSLPSRARHVAAVLRRRFIA